MAKQILSAGELKKCMLELSDKHATNSFAEAISGAQVTFWDGPFASSLAVHCNSIGEAFELLSKTEESLTMHGFRATVSFHTQLTVEFGEDRRSVGVAD